MKLEKKKIRLYLKKEIKKSKAPITGFLIACAIITEKNIYFGHNLVFARTVLAKFRTVLAKFLNRF